MNLAMYRIVTVALCALSSLSLLCSADRLSTVALYGGSSITHSHCGEGERAGNVTLVGNYSDFTEALHHLETREEQFSHFTLCLRPDSLHVLSSSVNVSSSVGIMSAEGNGGVSERIIVYCRLERPSESSYTAFFHRSQEVRLENLHFQGCPYPIGLELVENIYISNCLFQYFTEAVFDIFNCAHTNISHSHFLHNSGQGLSRVTSRGNTGGVAFGFRSSPTSLREVSIRLSHSVFFNNTAFSSSYLLSIDNLVYPGRGGALGIFVSHSFTNVSAIISDCVFRGNTAALFGGGLFYLIARESYHHQLIIRDTIFDSNFGARGASGVMLANPTIESVETDNPALFMISGCVFRNHTAASGGAIALFPSYLAGRGSQMIVRHSEFVNNRENESDPYAYGSAIAISEINIFSDRSSLPKHQISDCTFVNNSGENGVFNDGYAPVSFSGTNRFIGNRGTPLKIVGALVELSGSMNFTNNTVVNGAALIFTSFAQARLRPGLHIILEGNIGRLGAGIFVDNPSFHTTSVNNPLCFFLDETLTSAQWENITIDSRRNSAIEGSTLYIRRLESCGWTSLGPPFTDITAIRDWSLWNISESNRNTGFEGDMKTDASTVSVTTLQVTTWPGQMFQVRVSVKDQFDLLTSVTAEFTYNDGGGGGGRVVLQPELKAITSREEFTQNFTCVTSSQSASGTVQISNGLQSKAFQTQLLTLNFFEIDLLPCPGGYTIRSIETREGLWGCVCDSELEELLLCSDDQNTIFIRSGMWATYVPPVGGHNLEFHACPPGYCSCANDFVTDVSGATCMYAYSHSNPDQQCICGRQGILCGGCVNSSSVTALFNQCSDCGGASVLLIPGLIIADVFVFAVIALINAPLPEWAYPFLFYIQVAPYAVQYFPFSFDQVGKYLFYIGSASSFYFVYDFCVYDGMTSLWSSTLHYLPLITALLTLLPILGLKLCLSKRRSTLKHHGLWWIIFLCYSQIVYTSMSLLNCPSITDSDGKITRRWFVDGEVECFTGSHLALSLVAAVVLLLSLLLALSTAILPLYRGRHREAQWLTRLRDALSFSYRDNCEWWASVELGRRALVTLVLLNFPRNTTAVILVLSITLALYGLAQPYKHHWTNVSEVAILVNFIILLSLRQTPFFIDEYLRFPTNNGESGCGDHTPGGVATVSWVLLPFYYFPVLLFIVVAGFYTTSSLWRFITKKRGQSEDFQVTSLSYRLSTTAHGHQTTYASLRIGRGITHGVASLVRHNRNNDVVLQTIDTLTDPFL